MKLGFYDIDIESEDNMSKELPPDQWEDCPECADNSGTLLVQKENVRFVSREMALDAGIPEIEGFEMRKTIEDYEQCEFCHTNSKSVFYQTNRLWESPNHDDDLPF